MKPTLVIYILALVACGNADAEPRGKGNPFGTAIYPISYDVRVSASGDAGGAGMFDFGGMPQNPAQESFTVIDSAMAGFGVPDTDELAEATADCSATFMLNSGTDTLEGAFSGSGSGSGTDDPGVLGTPTADMGAGFAAEFAVDAPMAIVSLRGSMSVSATGGASSARGAVAVEAMEGAATFEIVRLIEVVSPGDTPSIEISEDISLPTGTYRLSGSVSGHGTVTGRKGGSTISVAGAIDLTFSVSPLLVEEVFWSVNDGTCDEPTNWEPQQVPGAAQTAVFDRDAIYTVSLGQKEFGRAAVERGNITFSGGALSLELGTEESPSLAVGRFSSDLAELQLETDLSSINGAIGGPAGTNGVISLGLGGPSSWSNQTSLIVGGAGQGHLRALDPVSTGELRIGDESTGNGMVDIGPATADPARLLEAGSVGIGLQGQGALHCAGADLSTGTVHLGVLEGGIGDASIDNGEWLINGELILGSLPGMADGTGGRGDFIIGENGTVECDRIVGIAGRFDGRGGQLRLRNTDSIIEGIEVHIGDLQFTSKGAGVSDVIGMFTVDGDIEVRDSMLFFDFAGMADGAFDVLEITGALALEGATIQFNFTDDYLPRAGDEIPFLLADSFTTNAVEFQYTGAAAGFQFDVMNVGGTLVFQAQSDAEAQDGEGEGEGEGESDGEGEGDGEPGGCASNGFPKEHGNMHFDLLICLAAVVLIAARRKRVGIENGRKQRLIDR